MEITLNVTEQEKLAIDALLKRMRQDAREVAASGSHRKRHFLPTTSQRLIYKVHVCAYHDIYIKDKNIPHKQLMIHYAAIYHVLAIKTGIDRSKFYGPDYDSFLLGDCGIKYNTSDTPRGRYRQIQDTYFKYKDCMKSGLPRNMVSSQMTPQNEAPSQRTPQNEATSQRTFPNEVPSQRSAQNTPPLNENLKSLYFESMRNMKMLLGPDQKVSYRSACVPKTLG